MSYATKKRKARGRPPIFRKRAPAPPLSWRKPSSYERRWRRSVRKWNRRRRSTPHEVCDYIGITTIERRA